MQLSRKNILLSVLLIVVMAFAMIRVATLTSFAATEISSMSVTCDEEEYASDLVQEGKAVPEHSAARSGFVVYNDDTPGVNFPHNSAYGKWCVQNQNGDREELDNNNPGVFEAEKTYSFKITTD